jgi:hypothetical protein
MAKSKYTEIREDNDGFWVTRSGYWNGRMAYFKKSDGWTRPMVEDAVSQLHSASAWNIARS